MELKTFLKSHVRFRSVGLSKDYEWQKCKTSKLREVRYGGQTANLTGVSSGKFSSSNSCVCREVNKDRTVTSVSIYFEISSPSIVISNFSNNTNSHTQNKQVFSKKVLETLLQNLGKSTYSNTQNPNSLKQICIQNLHSCFVDFVFLITQIYIYIWILFIFVVDSFFLYTDKKYKYESTTTQKQLGITKIVLIHDEIAW